MECHVLPLGAQVLISAALAERGEAAEDPMLKGHGAHMHHMMAGMASPDQMAALAAAVRPRYATRIRRVRSWTDNGGKMRVIWRGLLHQKGGRT